MKRGIWPRLFGRGGGDFESSRPWQPSLTQPAVATPVKVASPILQRHVRLPLQQAIISGLFAAFFPVAVAMMGVWFGTWKLGFADILFVYIGSASALCGVVWFLLLIVDRLTLLFNEIIDVAERWLGVDLNKDGAVGKPMTTIVDFVDREKRHRYIEELPVDDQVMWEIAHAMLESQGRYSFSRRDMMAATSISDEQFRKLQALFVKREWAVYKKKNAPNTGTVLLCAGKAVLRKYL